ncbi:ATP synthase subunit C lysine N-methyltransferase-like isoform X2 [Penaeus japonicus]|uniref:ATP synthase subunit C lysine N-methyltransferase-like isoform X2 n=1 Tax=Penaeus japonicus TaxID=27405 RepID=UPI001C714E10|nr:ATP synthase subunit C lysine N-methyltransferase-like isoform X2 [Penaeus japonicus]
MVSPKIMAQILRYRGFLQVFPQFIFSECGNEEKTQQSSRKVGLVLVGLTGGAAIGLSIIAAPFVAPALRKICLPYVPATTHQVNNVLRALKGRTGTLVDLGSGDGRIVVAAAKSAKLTGVGVELNPWLVWYSRWLAWKKGVSSSTSFMTHDLWKLNLQQYKNVVIFGVEEMMPDLESKLFQELTADGCVVACRFPLPTWQPIATFGEGIDTVWLYRRPNEDNVQHREDDESFVDNR